MKVDGASAGTRTRVQALATLGDNHYTTLAANLGNGEEYMTDSE